MSASAPASIRATAHRRPTAHRRASLAIVGPARQPGARSRPAQTAPRRPPPPGPHQTTTEFEFHMSPVPAPHFVLEPACADPERARQRRAVARSVAAGRVAGSQRDPQQVHRCLLIATPRQGVRPRSHGHGNRSSRPVVSSGRIRTQNVSESSRSQTGTPSASRRAMSASAYSTAAVPLTTTLQARP